MSHGEFSRPETTNSPFSTLQDPQESVSSSSLTTSERNGLSSGTQQSSSLEEGQTNPSPEDGRFRLLRRLEESVDMFRTGKESKTTTISTILRILRENADVEITQSQKDATFNSYLTEILSIQSSFNESNTAAPEDSSGELNQIGPPKESK